MHKSLLELGNRTLCKTRLFSGSELNAEKDVLTMKAEIRPMEAMKLVGCCEKIDLANQEFSGIGRAWERLFSSLDAVENQVANDQFWAITNGLFQADNSYTAARLVTEVSNVPDEFQSQQLPARQYAIFEHRGNPMAMGETIHKALQWIEESDEYQLDGNYNLEMYDSRCNPEQPDNYIVEIYFPVSG